MSEPTWTCTRSQLTDAIAGIKASVRVSGPAAGMVNAESMADVILEQLPRLPDGWVMVSGEDAAAILADPFVPGAVRRRLERAAYASLRDAAAAGEREAGNDLRAEPGAVSDALRTAEDSP